MEIRTARLTLGPIKADHLSSLADLLTDPEVKKTYMVPDFENREKALELAKRLSALSEDFDRYVFGVCLKGNLVGILNATEVQEERIELGYALLPAFYGQGYATEALRAMIDVLFSFGFREVIAGAFENNVASIRVMEKSGMQKLPRTGTVTYRGKEHRCVYYGITDTE